MTFTANDARRRPERPEGSAPGLEISYSAWSVDGMEPAALRGLERHVRHPARAHAGAWQARGIDGAARTAAAARRAAPERPGLGDAAAACPGWLRCPSRCVEPAQPSCRGRAQ